MNVLERFNRKMDMYHTRGRGLQGGDHSAPNTPSPISDRTDMNTSNRRHRERVRSGLSSARSQKTEMQKLKSETEQLKGQLKRVQATNVLLRKNFHRDKLDRDLVENMDLAQMLEQSAIEAQMQLKMYEAGDIDEKNMSPKLRAYVSELKADTQRLKLILERELKKRTHLQQAYDYLKTSRDKLEEEFRKMKREEENKIALPTLNEHKPHTEPEDTSKLEQAIYMLKRDLEMERSRNKDLERTQQENEKLNYIIKMLKEKVEIEDRRLEMKEDRLRDIEIRLTDRSIGDIDSSSIKMSATPETVRLQQELAKRKQEWDRDKTESALKINELRKEVTGSKHLIQKLTDELEEARNTSVKSDSKAKGKGRQKTGSGTELKTAKSALAQKEKQLQEAGQEIAQLKSKLSDAKNQIPSKQRAQSASLRITSLQERLKEEKAQHSEAVQQIDDLQMKCHNATKKINELEARAAGEARVAKETIQRKDKAIVDLRKQLVIMEDIVTTARAETELMKQDKDSFNQSLN